MDIRTKEFINKNLFFSIIFTKENIDNLISLNHSYYEIGLL